METVTGDPFVLLERRIAAGALVDDLIELVQIPSVTGSPGERDAAAWLAERLRGTGADVDHWMFDLPSLAAAPGFPGWEAERDDAWGVVGSWGTETPSLILAGHLDVVPPGELTTWTYGPFEARVVGDRIVGRGACDMKAGVVAMLAAASAMAEAGLASKLAVHGLAAEEDGGLGAFGTLARGHHGLACVIPEPTGGTVITANAGALGFRLIVPGRSAHGSMRYEGVDPVEKYLIVHDALRQLETLRNREVDPLLADYPIAYPLAVGTVRAGDWASTVPDSLVAEGRYGVRLDESIEDARAAFEAAVASACTTDPWLAENPAVVEWWGGQFASGRLPRGHELLGQVQDSVAAITGKVPAVAGAPYGSDLRHYAAAGIPTLHWGPGLVNQAHTADEWVSIDELHDAARGLTKLALARCT